MKLVNLNLQIGTNRTQLGCTDGANPVSYVCLFEHLDGELPLDFLASQLFFESMQLFVSCRDWTLGRRLLGF